MNPTAPSQDPLLQSLEPHLTSGLKSAEQWASVLDLILKRFACVTGTVHRLDESTQLLELTCQKGIPPPVLEKIRSIPIGKGMAGIAAERREPVQVCNLQTDTSGVVRQGARETRVEGAVACPILVDGKLKGTLGIAKTVAYEFTNDEIQLLQTVAARLGRSLS